MPTATERPPTQMASKIIDFACEPYSTDLMLEMRPLWQAHYEEIALYKEVPLSPMLSIYENAAMSDMLKIYTVRSGGELFGYEFFFVHQHSHFGTSKTATQDLLYLALGMRHGMTGYRFLKWVDEQLNALDVKLIYRYASRSNDYGPLLERLGYQQHDVVYSRMK